MTKRMPNKAWKKLPAEHAAYCQNCNWQGHYESLDPISHIHERTEEGDTVWAGDCPECGAMSFTVAEIERQEKPRKIEAAAGVMLAALRKLWDEAAPHSELHSALEDALGEAGAAINEAEAAGITAPEAPPEAAEIAPTA